MVSGGLASAVRQPGPGISRSPWNPIDAPPSPPRSPVAMVPGNAPAATPGRQSPAVASLGGRASIGLSPQPGRAPGDGHTVVQPLQGPPAGLGNVRASAIADRPEHRLPHGHGPQRLATQVSRGSAAGGAGTGRRRSSSSPRRPQAPGPVADAPRPSGPVAPLARPFGLPVGGPTPNRWRSPSRGRASKPYLRPGGRFRVSPSSPSPRRKPRSARRRPCSAAKCGHQA